MADEEQVIDETLPVRVPRDLAKMLGIISQHKGLSNAEYIDTHLRKHIVAAYTATLKEMQAAVGANGK